MRMSRIQKVMVVFVGIMCSGLSRGCRGSYVRDYSVCVINSEKENPIPQPSVPEASLTSEPSKDFDDEVMDILNEIEEREEERKLQSLERARVSEKREDYLFECPPIGGSVMCKLENVKTLEIL